MRGIPSQLPHEYYDENMLHGLLISEVKDYEEMHSSNRQFPAIRGQLGSLRHHVSEGVCQTQEGAIGQNQGLE